MIRYRPDPCHSPLSLSKNSGPIIVGQQDMGLIKALGNMSLSSCGGTVYSSTYADSPLSSPLCVQNSATHSFGMSEYQSEQSLSPIGDYDPGFTPRSSGHNSPWSPPYGQYPDFGIQPTSWPPFNPGAVGQERGTPLSSQVRSAHPLQQQRISGKPTGRQGHDYSGGHHNVVDVERIRLGTDVRTTVRVPSHACHSSWPVF